MTNKQQWCEMEEAANPHPCPKCGSPTDVGFGLAGGGYGRYTFCIADACDYFEKEQVDE